MKKGLLKNYATLKKYLVSLITKKLCNVEKIFGFATIFTKSGDLRRQFAFKSKEPKDGQKVVYKIKSNDCTRKYPGEVDCKLKERIKKLSSDSEKPKKKENIT